MEIVLDRYKPGTSYVTASHSVSDLIAFGVEFYEKYKGSGCLLYRTTTQHGSGFIAYKVKTSEIEIMEVFVDAPNLPFQRTIYESLIMCVRNDAAALNVPLVMRNVPEEVANFITYYNQLSKEQKVEESYWWKIRE